MVRVLSGYRSLEISAGEVLLKAIQRDTATYPPSQASHEASTVLLWLAGRSNLWRCADSVMSSFDAEPAIYTLVSDALHMLSRPKVP
jgi:hypothetical protein